MVLVRRASMTIAAFGALALAGCAHHDAGPRAYGGGGLFGGHRAAPSTAANLGVNAFLWRASLDTLAFMPLASADPFGGVIITDWYANPEKPDERFKCTVYILDTRLRRRRGLRPDRDRYRKLYPDPRAPAEAVERSGLTRPADGHDAL
jgi:hypothetical protein